MHAWSSNVWPLATDIASVSSVCWTQQWALQKRLNRWRCHLGCWLGWAQGPCIRLQPGSPRKGAIFGVFWPTEKHYKQWGLQEWPELQRIRQKVLSLGNMQVYFDRAIELYLRLLNIVPTYVWKKAASPELWHSIVDTAMLEKSTPRRESC